MRLAGLTAAQRQTPGSRLSPTEQRRLQPRLEQARQALTPAAAETAWAAGRDTSLEHAVAEVLDPAINAQAEDATEARLWAGIHFRSDLDAGLRLGRQVATATLDWARRQIGVNRAC